MDPARRAEAPRRYEEEAGIRKTVAGPYGVDEADLMSGGTTDEPLGKAAAQRRGHCARAPVARVERGRGITVSLKSHSDSSRSRRPRRLRVEVAVMPSKLHVERGVQFKADLYKKPNRTEWLTEVGKELEKRKLTITVAPGLQVKNAADLISFFKRYASDKSGLKAALALPPTTTIENYVQDLVQALDDTVKQTSTVQNSFVDFQPASPLGKMLGLDSSARYASSMTVFGKMATDAVANVDGIDVSRKADAVDPLAGQLFMDSTTFASMPSFQWNRDGVELEQVSGVTGVDAQELLKALRSTNSGGRTAYQRLRKPELCEAYTVGYSGVGLDEMPWDDDAHEQREHNKYVSLTIESGRYEAPATGQPREISLGTDKMDDTYYDTKDFALTDADFSVRGRARWDTDTEIRRILMAVKSNTTIDEFGIKRNGKVDVRNDGASADEIKSLDHDIRTGVANWNGSPQPFGPMKGVYDAVNAGGKLPDIGGHTDVLQLEPKFHMRSVRSRYHLNETSLEGLQDFHRKTTAKLGEVLTLATAAQATATGADKATVDALVKTGAALENGTALLAAVEAQLKALDPAMTVNVDAVKALMPSTTGSSWSPVRNDALSIEKKRVVADAMDTLYHQFAEQLDGARRIITGAQDRTFENHPKLYMAWAKTADPSLVNKRTYDAFLAKLDVTLAKPAAEGEADLKAFNDWANQQKTSGNRDFRDFKAMSMDDLKKLRPQLLNEVVRVSQRQLEAAGSSAKGLYFEEARAFFVPQARRNTGNFIIDTTDMSEFVKHDAWESIAEADRTPAKQIAADKIFHVTLVNETQIELGSEKPYLDRLTELQASINGDRASLIMKWMDSAGTAAIDATKPETYQAALRALLEQPAARRDAELAKLNDFMKAQGSALAPVGAKDLDRLVEKDFAFTVDQRNAAVRKEPTTERLLAGARWVFEQIVDVQKAVVDSKEDRVMKVLKDAGLRGAEWKQTADSKGNTGMKLVRGQPTT